MIDPTRWVVAEAWLVNGLRIRWSWERNIAPSDKSWQVDEDGERRFRYYGSGEWEVLGGERTSAGYTRGEPPMLGADAMLHELAHWLVATDKERGQRNFGIDEGSEAGREAEDRALAAERVLRSVVVAAARIASMALGAKP